MTKQDKQLLRWLGRDRGVGLSSKAIALTALGSMPKTPNYPHDPDDFSRCRNLIAEFPQARRGLTKLARYGGPVWKDLVARWDEIEAQFQESEAGGWNDNGKCYHLMRSIIGPHEIGWRTGD